MKKSEPTTLCDMLRFDRNEGRRVKVRDCELLNSFFFSRNDYFLLRKNKTFYICIPVDGTPVLVWCHPETKNGVTYIPNEIISMFRNEYMKKCITQKDIDEFINDPVGYEKKRLK